MIKTYCTTQRTYYKYVYNDFVQPTLTENGKFGGDSFAVAYSHSTNASGLNGSAYGNAYNYFQPNTDRLRMYRDEAKIYGWIVMYFPDAIRPTSFYIRANGTASDSSKIYNNAIYGGTGPGDTTVLLGTFSNVGKNEEATFNLSNVTDYYHYLVWRFGNGGSARNDACYVKSLLISGVTRKPVISTSSDYDYYVDTVQPYIINNKYMVNI